MFYLDESGKRVYTLEKTDPSGRPTQSAHPGVSSPLLYPLRIPRGLAFLCVFLRLCGARLPGSSDRGADCGIFLRCFVQLEQPAGEVQEALRRAPHAAARREAVAAEARGEMRGTKNGRGGKQDKDWRKASSHADLCRSRRRHQSRRSHPKGEGSLA
eukprot:scaffold3870_cov246-Pinguiococcus_pyrenoidosus.AAC.1